MEDYNKILEQIEEFPFEVREETIRKYNVIKPVLDGVKRITSISQENKLSQKQVSYWVSRYNKKGIRGLVHARQLTSYTLIKDENHILLSINKFPVQTQDDILKKYMIVKTILLGQKTQDSVIKETKIQKWRIKSWIKNYLKNGLEGLIAIPYISDAIIEDDSLILKTITSISFDEKQIVLQKYNILKPILKKEKSVTFVSKESGRHVHTLYKWLSRFKKEGIKGLHVKKHFKSSITIAQEADEHLLLKEIHDVPVILKETVIKRYNAIAPYLKNQKSLRSISKESNIKYSTLYAWLVRLTKEGIQGLINKRDIKPDLDKLDDSKKSRNKLDLVEIDDFKIIKSINKLLVRKREEAWRRYQIIKPYLEKQETRQSICKKHNISIGTLQAWLRQYKNTLLRDTPEIIGKVIDNEVVKEFEHKLFHNKKIVADSKFNIIKPYLEKQETRQSICKKNNISLMTLHRVLWKNPQNCSFWVFTLLDADQSCIISLFKG